MIDLRLDNDPIKNKRFEKLFVQKRPGDFGFLGSYPLKIKGIPLLKKLILLCEQYPGMKIETDPRGYDEDDDSRKAWVQFQLWIIERMTYDQSKCVAMEHMLYEAKSCILSDSLKDLIKKTVYQEPLKLEERYQIEVQQYE